MRAAFVLEQRLWHWGVGAATRWGDGQLMTGARPWTSDCLVARPTLRSIAVLRTAQDDRLLEMWKLGGFAAGEEFAELVDVGGGDGYQFCVGEDVLRVGHADQSGGDAGGGADELERALGVVFEAERFGDERREISRDLALEERGAGDKSDTEIGCGLHRGFFFSVDGLISLREGFGHAEVERELDEAEVMIFTCHVLGGGGYFGELHRIAGPGFLTEAVPRGHAVKPNLSILYGRFQKNERVADAFEEVGARNFAELRFRVVEIVDVDAIDPKIFEAAAELIFEEARRHAVASADDVVGRQDARLNVFAIEVVVRIGRHRAVGREVTALRANDEFFAGVALLEEVFDGGADAAFAALKSIVDSAVDDVDPSFDGGCDTGGGGLIGFVTRSAEISADTDGGEDEALGFAEVAVGGATWETLSVFLLAGGCGGCGHCEFFPWSRLFVASDC